MSSRAKNVSQTILDPIFLIPEGAEEEFVYIKEPDDSSARIEFDDILYDETLDITETEMELDSVVDLTTPDQFSIISQVLRRAPGGQQVVDIIIEIEDINGATTYEVRITKGQ